MAWVGIMLTHLNDSQPRSQPTLCSLWHGLAAVASCLPLRYLLYLLYTQFVAWAGSCRQLSSLAVLGLEGLHFLGNAELRPLLLSGCSSSLKSLQFDQHVVITGVQVGLCGGWVVEEDVCVPGCSSSFRCLQFDQHVVITGVQVCLCGWLGS